MDFRDHRPAGRPQHRAGLPSAAADVGYIAPRTLPAAAPHDRGSARTVPPASPVAGAIPGAAASNRQRDTTQRRDEDRG